jgi:HSP20 family molecular chaperone IbpA
MSLSQFSPYSNDSESIRDILLPVTGILRDFDNYFTQSSPSRIWEDAISIYFETELPGYLSSDIDIDLDDKFLSISAKKMVKTSQGTQQKIAKYRHTIPQNIDIDRLSARLENGVLIISAPKNIKSTHTRKISILE